MSTLLNGVNDVLTRGKAIDSGGELTSLSNDAKQVWIDLAVQLWNETVDQIYSETGQPKPNVLKEDTITLVQGDRDYALETDLVRLHWPLQNESEGRYIVEFSGGYLSMVNSQPHPANFVGVPLAGAIRPTDGQLYLDMIPSSDAAGLVFKYRYEKDLELTDASDEFPFGEAVYRALVPAVSQLFKLERQGKEAFAGNVFRSSFGRACRLISKNTPRDSYLPRGVRKTVTDPMSDA